MGEGGRNGGDGRHHPAATPFPDGDCPPCCAGGSKMSIIGLRIYCGKSSMHKTLPQIPKYCWLPPALETGRMWGHICPRRIGRGSRRGGCCPRCRRRSGKRCRCGKCLSLFICKLFSAGIAFTPYTRAPGSIFFFRFGEKLRSSILFAEALSRERKEL